MKKEGRKGDTCPAGIGARLRRVLCSCFRPGPGRQSAGGALKEVGHFLSSYGRWPGHEAGYPVLLRMLWEAGKDRQRRREERRSERPKDRKNG